MFGKTSQLTPLQSRKQLLLAESELHRAQLEQECRVLLTEVHTLTQRARHLGCLFSTATALVALFAAARGHAAQPAAAKPSWWQSLLKSAGWLSTLWTTVRPPPADHAKRPD